MDKHKIFVSEKSQVSRLNTARQGDEQAGPPSGVVDRVSEARCVYDGEPQFDSFLLDADCVFDNVHSLVDSF